jgi:phosphopantothenoylcysteine decarboxylase / phosphopantothenate---cysteine ligase
MLLKNKKIIITGGPTREWLDPVRFLSNPSTGKMGIAIADEALKKAIDVVFIHGPINIGLEEKSYKTIEIESTKDLLDSVVSELEDNAILIMAAAPVDYTVKEKSFEKIKKSGDELELKLVRTPDILLEISKMNESGKFKNLFLVGFAAETENLKEYAIGKLKSKNLDMLCLNDVSQKNSGFGTNTNILTLFNRDHREIKLPILSKNNAALKILKQIEHELSKKSE